jgi:hypothetical protein
VKLRLVDRDAFPAFGKIFSVRKKFSGRLVSIFSRIKKSSGGDDSQQDSAERAFNKLARTFAAQLETLKRYRGGGEQTMPRGVATARGRRLDGGSSRLDLSARRTSMTTSDRDPGYRASSAGIVPMSAFGGKADITRTGVDVCF